MFGKIANGVIAMLVGLLLLLLLNRNSLSNQVEKREKELVVERATNTALGNIIDAYQLNDAANRFATARQFENERKLRNESDEQLRRFKTAAARDTCAVQPMPTDVINLLRE